MADAIAPVKVMSRHLSQWGVDFNEYDYASPVEGGTTVLEGLDFERLTIKISNRRAVVIESEVQPMAVRMDRRNKELDQLGKALSDLSAFSAEYHVADDGKMIMDADKTFSMDGVKGLVLAGVPVSKVEGSNDLSVDGVTFSYQTTYYNVSLRKDRCDKWTQLVKTATDTRNNDSSMDMTRIESLVNRRDEAYNTSSSLSEKISGTRSTTIKNFV